MSRKLLLQDAHGQREFLLVGTLTVGRDPRCEISANDPLLSRQHAEFVETASGVLVRDLHSQNGIKVNDISVKEAALQTGDTIQIARMNLRFVEDASAQAPSAGAGGDDDKTQVLQAQPQFGHAAPAPAPSPVAGRAVAAPPASGPGPVTPLPPTPVPPSAAAPAAAAPAPSFPAAGAFDDRTNIIPRPAAAASPAPASAPGTAGGTLVMPAPAHAPAAPVAPIAASAPASAAPRARAGADSEARSAPPAAPARPQGRAAATAPAAVPGAEDAVSAHSSKARAPRGSWAGRVLLRVLMLGLLCSLVAAVPLMFWHQQQMSSIGISRATTMGNWFAAEAASALEKGGSAEPAVDIISREAGVVAARVLTPEGHVIAPASRAAEVVPGIPAIGIAPAEILHQHSAWNGDLLEVAQPVATSKGPRTAIVWLTLNPVTEFGGSSLVIVAPAVVVAIFVAWIVAMLITRPTLKALGHLNEDVELALSGRLDGVHDPLGAKPVKELTDTINYLAARIRTTGLDVALDRGSRGPSSVTGVTSVPSAVAGSAAGRQGQAAQGYAAPAAGGAAASAFAASPAPAPVVPVTPAAGGCLIVDTAFRVVNADAPCALLLGTSVDALVGRHLLDAISDRTLVDAVLGCLSALPAEGARETTATDATGRIIAVTVGRTGKDQPVTITLRAGEARQA